MLWKYDCRSLRNIQIHESEHIFHTTYNMVFSCAKLSNQSNVTNQNLWFCLIKSIGSRLFISASHHFKAIFSITNSNDQSSMSQLIHFSFVVLYVNTLSNFFNFRKNGKEFDVLPFNYFRFVSSFQRYWMLFYSVPCLWNTLWKLQFTMPRIRWVFITRRMYLLSLRKKRILSNLPKF